jgi:hypothetical protein
MIKSAPVWELTRARIDENIWRKEEETSEDLNHQVHTCQKVNNEEHQQSRRADFPIYPIPIFCYFIHSPRGKNLSLVVGPDELGVCR